MSWPTPKEHPMQEELRKAAPYELTWSDANGHHSVLFWDHEKARAKAEQFATDNKGRSYYIGSPGGRPLDQTRYCWDNSQNQVVQD